MVVRVGERVVINRMGMLEILSGVVGESNVGRVKECF